MAREVVITSVPRGVKLGRTGFQVAMQTTGMRDDLVAALEKMAGYRHLPSGSGANPVCYFHRLARTIAGQVHVLGRIVDAGVDFSNRSNKLAHLIVLEPTETGLLASSSPAAALAAIEPRLASSWPGAPEERQAPFILAGVPATQPALCRTWAALVGDAGWAGVIADRAIRNQPTLLIGSDASPASCRRLLALFDEALALIPSSKRWSITFDTTSITQDGVLWRGTYAGSPESQLSQPGVLVIDLTRPQTLPQALAGGDLVQLARSGGSVVGPRTAPPAAAGAAAGSLAVNPASAATSGPKKGAGGIDKPPPPPFDEDQWQDVPLGSGRRRSVGGLVAIGVSLVVFTFITAAAIGGYVVWARQAERQAAVKKIQDYANANKPEEHVPSVDDYVTALGKTGDTEFRQRVKTHWQFLNDVLASQEVESDRTDNPKLFLSVLDAAETLSTSSDSVKGENAREEAFEKVFGKEKFSGGRSLLADVPQDKIATYAQLRAWAKACDDLEMLSKTPKEKREKPTVDGNLWSWLTEKPDGAKVDQLEFIKNVEEKDVKSLDTLRAALSRGDSTAGASRRTTLGAPSQAGSDVDHTSKGVEAGPPSSPEEAFDEVRLKLKSFGGETTIRTNSKTNLFSIDEKLPKALDADLTLGTREGFSPKAMKNGQTQPYSWELYVGDDPIGTVAWAASGWLHFQPNATGWDKHKSKASFMPIAFHRPTADPAAQDWFALQKPDDVTAESDKTLNDLFCNAERHVPLPACEGLDWPAVKKPPIRTGEIDTSNGKLKLRLQPCPVGVSLNFELIDDGETYLLQEQIEIDAKSRAMRRQGDPWGSQKLRFGAMFERVTPEIELVRLGLGDKGQIPTQFIPDLFRCFLRDSNGKPISVDSAERFLKEWRGSQKNFPVTLNDWRESLRSYIAERSHPFALDASGRYEMLNGPCEQPGLVPVQRADEPSSDFKRREKQHDEKVRRQREWSDGRDRFVKDSGRMPERLAVFLDEKAFKNETDGIKDSDPKIAAVYVLRELDGLIIAKKYRKELEQFLKQVTLGAIFEGEVTQVWNIDGLGDVDVPVARIRPAPVLPLQPSAGSEHPQAPAAAAQ